MVSWETFTGKQVTATSSTTLTSTTTTSSSTSSSLTWIQHTGCRFGAHRVHIILVYVINIYIYICIYVFCIYILHIQYYTFVWNISKDLNFVPSSGFRGPWRSRLFSPSCPDAVNFQQQEVDAQFGSHLFDVFFFCWPSAVWWTSCLLPNHVLTGQFIQFKTLFRCPDFVLENVCVLPLMCQTASVICQVVAAHPPQQPPPRFLADMETHSRTHRYV